MVRRKVAHRAKQKAAEKEEEDDAVAAADSPEVIRMIPVVGVVQQQQEYRGEKAGKRQKNKNGKHAKPRQPRATKSLPDTTLRRAVIVYGPKRVGSRTLNEMRTQVEDVVAAVVADATRSAACEGRKTIKGRDTRRALKARGILLV